MSNQTQQNIQRRFDIFDRLADANNWLAQRAAAGDLERFDLEAARVRVLADLTNNQRPDLPTVLDDYGNRRTVVSIEDMIELREGLIDQMEMMLDDPESFGVILLDSLEEQQLLLTQEDA